ncbi:MAG TPA: exodeoxyribonuclease V subunit alpha [Rubrivivax sp.]|nr:exodeoxyribonuclease V subunit alpha [Rubrivivax sp.]
MSAYGAGLPAAPAPQGSETGAVPRAAADGHALLAVLQEWVEAGWLRRLDAAFACFVLELCPDAGAPVVLAAALAAHLEGQGHACLPVDELLHDAEALLGWPAAAQAPLRALMSALPERANDWLQALRASPLVAADDEAAAPAGTTPLVLHGQRLYLRRYWRHEQTVAAGLRQRLGSVRAVDAAAARRWLDALFPGTGSTLSTGPDWQKLACALALRNGLTLVTGGPGTGKTFTAARLLALLFAVDPAPQRLRVALAAPTGKAAARLKQAMAAALAALPPDLAAAPPLRDLAARIGPAQTLHRLLGARPDTRRFRHDAAHPLPLDVLIVDEASMVHLEMMAALLQALPPQARLVLLGDKDQLASVEAGAVLGDLCRGAEAGRYGPATADFALAVAGQVLPAGFVTGGPPLAQQTVMLRHSHRFGGPIGELAAAVNQGDAARAAAVLRAAPFEALHWLEAPSPAAVVRLALDGRTGAEGGYAAYLHEMRQRPEPADVADTAAFDAWVLRVLDAFDRFRLLCAVREGEWGAAGLNAAVERALSSAGWLVRRGQAFEGRPVMVTRNDPGLGVFNGDTGVTLLPATPGAPLRIYFRDGPALRSVAASRLPGVETAFAMTVHKSQGSEFEHTVLVLPKEPSRVLTRELVYTGVTRARRQFTLVTGRSPALAAALAQRTRRAGGLLEALESPESLASLDRSASESAPPAG